MDAKGALGEAEANLVALNEEFHLPYIPELVQRKIMGSEGALLGPSERDFHRAEYLRLIANLEETSTLSHLSNETRGRERLNELLIRVRLQLGAAHLDVSRPMLSFSGAGVVGAPIRGMATPRSCARFRLTHILKRFKRTDAQAWGGALVCHLGYRRGV
jgi:hypothetical protein